MTGWIKRGCRRWCGALLLLASLCLSSGCVDPFEQETTTPAKLGARQAASRAGAHDKHGGSSRNADADKKKEEKAEQTYQQAWQLICKAEELSAVPRDATRDARGAAVASWIVDHVTNKKARYWFIEFGNAKPQDKAVLFLAEVKRVGLDNCPLVDLIFDRDAPPGPATNDAGPADDARR